jgi:membrane-associated phospholipid phosphatase/protein tyrosine phosphatase (PTP) superfamily phosphohydrolase (DUF442 family)
MPVRENQVCQDGIPADPGLPVSAAPLRRKNVLVFLLGVLLPLFLFGWLGEAVWNRGGLDWDPAALKLVHQHDSATLDKVVIGISEVGDIRLVLFFTVACAIGLLVAHRKRDERFLAHCVVGAAATIFLVKTAFHRVRSHFWESLPPQMDLGSPSAHSMGTFALVLTLVVIGWRTRWRWVTIFLGVAYAVSVGLSRVYLGVHQASDVLAAWALTLAWMTAMSLTRSAAWAERPPKRKCALFVTGLLASAALVLAGYISSDLVHDNLRVVVRGQAYRAGQMSTNALAQCIHTYGIKSVVNLRGKNATYAWYSGETATTERLNVAHYDLGISAGQELAAQDMDRIAQLLQAAPKPVLIHCNAGADRSGLASAIYLYTIAGRTSQEAGRELSQWNGHVPLLRPWVRAMDHSFRRYVTNRVSQRQVETLPGE